MTGEVSPRGYWASLATKFSRLHLQRLRQALAARIAWARPIRSSRFTLGLNTRWPREGARGAGGAFNPEHEVYVRPSLLLGDVRAARGARQPQARPGGARGGPQPGDPWGA